MWKSAACLVMCSEKSLLSSRADAKKGKEQCIYMRNMILAYRWVVRKITTITKRGEAKR